jgi:hypothetical protein
MKSMDPPAGLHRLIAHQLQLLAFRKRLLSHASIKAPDLIPRQVQL